MCFLAGDLTVVGNVGDDIEILGLHVSPDLDSLLYTLAGLIDEKRGWGRESESWNALASASWGADDWFRLGDRDIGLHLVRTEMLDDGVPLSSITAHLVERARVSTQIFPATDDRLRTNVHTPAGTFPFQEWFVARKHADDVEEVSYEGAPEARPAPGVLETLRPRMRSSSPRATRTCRLGRLSPCARSAKPSRLGVSDALPSVRSSGARRSQGHSTVCSPAWLGARLRAISPGATTG